MDPAPADKPTLYYVEHDGQVYLVDRDGRLSFPTEDELPFEYEVRVETEFDVARVLFCVPKLREWPRDWVFKDAIPAMEDVDPLVRRAVNGSLVREVSGALILHERDGVEHMLMVKASRGFTKGMWNIPGGFVTYGETPEESCRREIKEETGLDIRVDRLIGVYTARFASPYFMRGHMFLCTALTHELKLNPDEIAAAQWMPLRQAYEETINTFCRNAITDHEATRDAK